MQFENMESRKLLATLALVGTELRYTGSNSTADNVTVEYISASNRYRFSDPTESITTALPDLDPSANVAEVDVTAIAAFNLVRINNQAGGTTQSITLNSMRAGDALVTTATSTTDVINFSGGLGTTSSRIGSVTVSGDTVNLGADIHSSGVVSIAPAINVTANSTVSTTSNISISSTINGSNELTLQASGSATLRGAVGANTPLSKLAVNAGTNITLGTATVKVPISATGDVSLSAVGTIAPSEDISSGGALSISAASISYQGTSAVFDLNGTTSIAITGIVAASTAGANLSLSGGTIDVNGTIGVNSAVTVSGSSVDLRGLITGSSITVDGSTSLNTNALRASTGSLAVNSNIAFSHIVGTILLTAGTDISFAGTVVGNGSTLQLRNANTVAVAGAMSGVGFLDAQRGSGAFTNVALAGVSATSATITGTTVELSGDIVVSADDIIITGNVELHGSEPTITLQSGLGSGDEVSLTGNVDDSGVVQSFEMIAGLGISRILGGGLVGSVAPIDSLLMSGSRVDVGNAEVSNNITLKGDVLNITAAANGLVGSGKISYQSSTADLKFYNLASPPVVSGLVLGLNHLSTIAPGFTTLELVSPGTTTLFGDSLQATAIDFSSKVTNLTLIGQSVNLQERVNLLASGTLELQADTSASFTQNGLLLNGDVLVTKRTAGPGTLSLSGRMATSPSMPWGPFDLTINGNGGDVALLSEVVAQNIVVTSDTNLLDVRTTTALTAANDITINSDVKVRAGIFNRGTGTTLVTGNMILGGNTLLLAGNGGSIVINGTVSPDGSLLVPPTFAARSRIATETVALVQIDGAVTGVGTFTLGAGVAQARLGNVSSLGALTANATQLLLNGSLTANNGNLILTGAVKLVGDSSISNLSPTIRTTQINGTINGTYDLGILSTSGSVILGGAVGGLTLFGFDPLESLSIMSVGSNTINQQILVNSLFSWVVGTNTLASERLTVRANVTASSPGSTILLSAYRVDVLVGVNLTASTVDVFQH